MHFGICANVQSREGLHCIISETIWKYIFFSMFYKTIFITSCMFSKCSFNFYLFIPFFHLFYLFTYFSISAGYFLMGKFWNCLHFFIKKTLSCLNNKQLDQTRLVCTYFSALYMLNLHMAVTNNHYETMKLTRTLCIYMYA